MAKSQKLGNDFSLAYSRGLTAWKLRELHWAWAPKPMHAMVLRLHGEPVAVARTFPRLLSNKDIRIPVMGIGGVFVERENRRQGLARLVVAATCQRLQQDRVLAACLYSTDQYKWLYRGLGFEEVQPGFMVKPLVPGVEFTPLEFPLIV